MLCAEFLARLDELDAYQLCALLQKTEKYIARLFPTFYSPYHKELSYEIAKRLIDCGDPYIEESIKDDYPNGFPISPQRFDIPTRGARLVAPPRLCHACQLPRAPNSEIDSKPDNESD
ncbi:hypothetical protein R1flu_020993 [Riccia fluitans]|uniref:Uncharacterized protein n=1 Tax=Riccia fluitans TaxID=41844 RepID=A0ABD1ZPK7_9MARC